MICLATIGKQTAVLVSARELACISQTYHRIMKKELTLGTPSVPVLRIDAAKFRELLNKCLPQECQVKNATDGWYVGAIGALCVTFVFPPALLALAYCVIRAKKAEKGGGR